MRFWHIPGPQFPHLSIGANPVLLPHMLGDLLECPSLYSGEVLILFFVFSSEFFLGSRHMPGPAWALQTWPVFSP